MRFLLLGLCLVAVSIVPQQPGAPILPGASKNFAPLANSESQSWTEKYIDLPELGQTNVYLPKSGSGSFAIFLSGDDGWTLGVVDWARRIAARNVNVMGVNFVWLRRHQGDVACWDTAAVLKHLGIEFESRARGGVQMTSPVTLIGYSSGATMVYGALAQGAAADFKGGMSLGFCPDLPSARPACPVGDWQPTFDEPKHTAWLPTTSDIKRDWYVLHGLQDSECTPGDTEKFVSAMAHAHYVPIEGTGHGFAHADRWGPPFDAAVAKLFTGK